MERLQNNYKRSKYFRFITKPIYFSSSSLQSHIWIYNRPDVYQASLNFHITTSTNISAHEYFEAFVACSYRSQLSLPQGHREYSVISWSILAGRRNQTIRPDIKEPFRTSLKIRNSGFRTVGFDIFILNSLRNPNIVSTSDC